MLTGSSNLLDQRFKRKDADYLTDGQVLDYPDNSTVDIMGIKYVAEEKGFEFPTPFVLQMDNNAARIFLPRLRS